MIIENNLSGFYRKTEQSFIGGEINYKFMTSKQLDTEIKKSIALSKILFPAATFSPFEKALSAVAIGGAIAVAGAAIIAAYGVPSATAAETLPGGATAANVSAVQSAATVASASGVSPVTGAALIPALKSKTAFSVLKGLALTVLAKKGMSVAKNDTRTNALLDQRIKLEQQKIAIKAALLKKQELHPQIKKASMIKWLSISVPALLFLVKK